MRSRKKTLALLAVVASALLLAHCEQILNLDQWSLADANITSDASDGGSDANASDAQSSDAFQLPDGVSEASSWASWRMENSLVEVLDGASDASLQSFGPAGDAGIHDNLTNLVWNTNVGTAGSFAEAAAYCDALKLRLPTRIELVSLIDTTRKSAPYIAPAFDLVVANTAYWTSSYARPIVDNIVQYWFVQFFDGNVAPGTPSMAGVMCVQ